MEELLMRAFVAIPLSKECQRMLDQLQQTLRACGTDVRWVSISSIHLTLKFMGETDPEIIPQLTESFASAAKSHHALDLRLHGLGCFPNHKSPHVIWCGIQGDTESLSRLQRDLEAACVLSGFAPEIRPYHPHLTLGRVHGKRNLQPLVDCIKIGSDLACSFKADHFNIYESTLRPQGAVYTVLETIVLSGCK
jgi:2'-5' RNA ligase